MIGGLEGGGGDVDGVSDEGAIGGGGGGGGVVRWSGIITGWNRRKTKKR